MPHGQNASFKHAKQKELDGKRYKKAESHPTNGFSKQKTHKHERQRAKKLIQEQTQERDLEP